MIRGAHAESRETVEVNQEDENGKELFCLFEMVVHIFLFLQREDDRCFEDGCHLYFHECEISCGVWVSILVPFFSYFYFCLVSTKNNCPIIHSRCGWTRRAVGGPFHNCGIPLGFKGDLVSENVMCILKTCWRRETRRPILSLPKHGHTS